MTGRVARVVLIVIATSFTHGLGLAVRAQAPNAPARPPVSNSTRLLEALRANPLTAPYGFSITTRPGGLTLVGRVGTKQVHDAAIQCAIDLGIPVRDDLVIDTRELARAGSPPLPVPMMIYPPPLFGRIDDPFYGFEPPLVSFPPWWQPNSPRDGTPPVGAATARLRAPGNPADPPIGALDLTVDETGAATLRGTVISARVREELLAQVQATPGVTRVIDQLRVAPAQRASRSDEPPPPPVPALGRVPRPVPAPPRAAPPAETPRPAIRDNGVNAADPLALAALDAIQKRPALATLGIRAASDGNGTVTLNGRVPSAYEAMLAFRAAQQVPGVRQINDRLSFDPPDIDQPNPLREKARPEDLVPYLQFHVSRQLGDLAHVDRIAVHGDAVEIVGTVARLDDTPRVEASLRSIPLLRGFRLEPRFTLP